MFDSWFFPMRSLAATLFGAFGGGYSAWLIGGRSQQYLIPTGTANQIVQHTKDRQ